MEFMASWNIFSYFVTQLLVQFRTSIKMSKLIESDFLKLKRIFANELTIENYSSYKHFTLRLINNSIGKIVPNGVFYN